MSEELGMIFSRMPTMLSVFAKQPFDDHTYNELVQAVGIIRAAADGAKCNMEDGFPVDHAERYNTILRATDRLAAVIRHVRGYGSVSFEAVKAEYEAEQQK